MSWRIIDISGYIFAQRNSLQNQFGDKTDLTFWWNDSVLEIESDCIVIV